MASMDRPGSPARRGFRSGVWLVIAAALASGCLVSFDGYQALDGGGGEGVGAGRDGSGGKTGSGGKGGGGKASAGGSNGGMGATEALGGAGAEPAGGSAPGGGAGSTAGGKAGNAGSAGLGGSASGSGGAAGSAGNAGSSGNAGSGGSPPKNCPVNLAGPPLIEIPKAGGGFFCMDRTEVPNEDYQAFLDTNPSTAGQATECSWNNSFQPDASAACASTLGSYDPVGRPRSPVSCIDWCDAKRYCAWAGKRLCGAISGGGNPPASYIDAGKSQWYRACSKAGTLKFPYGNSYQGSYCIGVDSPYTDPASVANAPACQGGYQGLFDMSGNVAEWEDSCTASTGATDDCLTRGGSLLSADTSSPSLLCNDSSINAVTPSPAVAKRNKKNELIGLRCCYDP